MEEPSNEQLAMDIFRVIASYERAIDSPWFYLLLPSVFVDICRVLNVDAENFKLDYNPDTNEYFIEQKEIDI